MIQNRKSKWYSQCIFGAKAMNFYAFFCWKNENEKLNSLCLCALGKVLGKGELGRVFRSKQNGTIKLEIFLLYKHL
jgi:hypothetical protein